MTLDDWLRSAVQRLEAAGVESARLEAQVLASHALQVERTWVLAHGGDPIEPDRLETMLSRRERREPLAYILGWREFYGRRFAVDSRVLIPRQETELLVDAALDRAPRGARILDIGTGSGCIAVTLKLERPELRVTACDISEQALEVAEANAKALSAEVEFIHSDLFLNLQERVFDIIVSNPPYIAQAEPLQPEVGEFEPPTALFGGTRGDETIALLAREAASHLTPDGVLIIEFGYDQSDSVTRILKEAGWSPEKHLRDLSGISRVAVARKEISKAGI